MRTPRGTDYATLRRLAASGTATKREDCQLAEHTARVEHACGFRELATLDLLIARAMWSAWRATQRNDA